MSFDLLRMVVPFWFWLLLLLLLLLASCFLLFVSVNGMDIVEVLFDLVLILCHQVFSRHPHQSQTIVPRFDSCCGFLPVVPRRRGNNYEQLKSKSASVRSPVIGAIQYCTVLRFLFSLFVMSHSRLNGSV